MQGVDRWMVAGVLILAGLGATGCGPKECTPQCTDRACGADGCGGSCGTCPGKGTCDEASGQCLCEPECFGKSCGDDRCGGTCGTCSNGAQCNPYTQRCTGGCQPDCTGRECGNDGCGGTCGGCTDPLVCNALGKCADQCVPQCAGKACGADGCGGECGTCPDGHDCSGGACVPGASCTDGRQNGQESDVDCGGSCPQKCRVGQGCGTGNDCKSGACDGGECVPGATCANNQKDAGETDLDCGGECDGCPIGKVCKVHGDCLSLNCEYGVCAQPTCEDGSKNQDETDTDCGGKKCEKCAAGRVCRSGADCASGDCPAGICVSCGDGIRNGDETDTDCGGSCPQRCGIGKACKVGADCQGGGCDAGSCCQANTCGKCAPQPVETCNGKDDDCNGVADDGLASTGVPCPNQAGVCVGAVHSCLGATGWGCSVDTYLAHDYRYQSKESSCDDGADNDCDGLTDWSDTQDCCKPQCIGKTCGDDGCGGTCGTCPYNKVCWVGSPTYATCTPKCGSSYPTCKGYCGKTYGSDGVHACNAWDCEGSGTVSCTADYLACCKMDCTPNCAGKTCGGDGCGGSCGTCDSGAQCLDGQCVWGPTCGSSTTYTCKNRCGSASATYCRCDPNCSLTSSCCEDYATCGCGPSQCSCDGKGCGDDGCGGSCGTCPAGYECSHFTCVPSSGGCGGVSQAGCCAGSTLKYCDNSTFVDVLKVENCAGTPAPYCGWDSVNRYYNCLATSQGTINNCP